MAKRKRRIVVRAEEIVNSRERIADRGSRLANTSTAATVVPDYPAESGIGYNLHLHTEGSGVGAREFGAVLLVFAGYVGLAAWVPPLDDELYYWCWSRELQWSYYDHPAMTAVMIRASTELFGDSVLAIRLPACAAMAAVFALLLRVTRPKPMLLAALVTPPFTFGAVLMTPDTPLLLFWALYLKWLVGMHEKVFAATSGAARAGAAPEVAAKTGLLGWATGGGVLGLGVLGKYTMALAGICAFASFLLLGRRHLRRWLPGYVLHGVVSLAVASPILIHNIRHDFAPLRYQWAHAMSDDGPGLAPLAEFVGVQILLVGTLPLVLLPWTFRQWNRLTADPRLRACACLYALPLAFFLFKATRGRLEGNWALAAYLGFWPVAGVWWEQCGSSAVWRWLTRAAFAIPAACVLVVAVHLLTPLPFLPTKHDRIHRPTEQQRQYRAVAVLLAGRGPVFTPRYQLVAGLRFHGVDARQLDGRFRHSHFTQTPDDPGRYPVWYWFSDIPLPPDVAARFPPPIQSTDIPLTLRGEVIVEYTLWEYRSPSP